MIHSQLANKLLRRKRYPSLLWTSDNQRIWFFTFPGFSFLLYTNDSLEQRLAAATELDSRLDVEALYVLNISSWRSSCWRWCQATMVLYRGTSLYYDKPLVCCLSWRLRCIAGPRCTQVSELSPGAVKQEISDPRHQARHLCIRMLCLALPSYTPFAPSHSFLLTTPRTSKNST